jgi:uncharacterized membrane protein YeaQ/YmgE (transglycosylase-associated protein family)
VALRRAAGFASAPRGHYPRERSSRTERSAQEEERMLAADIDITVADIIVYVIAGLVIGALARLLIPGRQNMSIVATIVLGVIAALVGGLLWEAIFPGNDGIAWIGSIIVAVLLLILYGQFFGTRHGTRSV